MRISLTRLAPVAAVSLLLVNVQVLAQQVTPVQSTTQQPLAPSVQGQAPAPPPAAVPAAPPQAPAGFQLNQVQQAVLNQVLDVWQQKSGQINTFKSPFERWEYNAFSPKVNGEEAPLNKCSGELSYHRPDKGSFQITEVRAFQLKPAEPGQDPKAPAVGEWVKQESAIGEHWVCDGKSVYEYRHHQKQLVERPIPPQLQGQGIVDGPLPFLFGAEAAKLKARYWLRVEQQPNPDEVWLTALPRFQAQAADFSKVEVILDRKELLPKAMRVQLPDGSRHVYMFELGKASVNNPLAVITSMFARPHVPLGWKRVVEPMPLAQAAPAVQEQQPAR